jgi:hypothetical protein
MDSPTTDLRTGGWSISLLWCGLSEPRLPCGDFMERIAESKFLPSPVDFESFGVASADQASTAAVSVSVIDASSRGVDTHGAILVPH